MESRPVAHSEKPKYPTRREILTAAAVIAVAGVTGGLPVLAQEPRRGQAGSGAGNRVDSRKAGAAKVARGELVVAPLFIHGEGRGATGCVVMVPPIFLSEEEGLLILREELATQGIDLKPGGIVAGVRVPQMQTERNQDRCANGTVGPATGGDDRATAPLELDGLDEAKKIGVQFVSRKDYCRRGGGISSSSMVKRYHFQHVAGALRELAEKQGRGPLFLGIFYDPVPRCTDPDPGEDLDWKEWLKAGRMEAHKLLRLQATDFVAWLKQQGGV